MWILNNLIIFKAFIVSYLVGNSKAIQKQFEIVYHVYIVSKIPGFEVFMPWYRYCH